MIFHPILRLRNLKRRIFRRPFDYIWLDLDFVPSELPDPPIPFFQRVLGLKKPSKFSVWSLRKDLIHAAKTLKFHGIIIDLRLSGSSTGFARLQSLINIFKKLRDEYQKEIIVISHYYSLPLYWFSSAVADKVFLIRTGIVDIRGIKSEITFLGKTLDKFGFKFEKVAVSGYKSAGDQLARSDIAPEAKENIQWLLDEYFEIMKRDILQARRLKETDFNDLIDNAPWMGKDAIAKGLIDSEITLDELHSFLKKRKKRLKIIEFTKTKKIMPLRIRSKFKKGIAIIEGQGMIVDGKSQPKPPVPTPLPMMEETMGDRTIVQTIRRTARNKAIKAVVFYVNSIGGSVTASESIKSALESLGQKKPTVIYFDNVAASGGYYIAVPGQKIICQPLTITGSIGVLNGKFSASQALKTIQANPVIISKGKRSEWDSIARPYNEEERQTQKMLIETMYDHFLDLVQKSRSIQKAKLKNEIAGGRVWTGTQAYELGLVDGLGDITFAIKEACKLAKIKEDAPVIQLFHKDVFVPPQMTDKLQELSFSLTHYFNTLAGIKTWAIMNVSITLSL